MENKKNLFKSIFSKNEDEDDPHLKTLINQLHITDYEKKMISNIIELGEFTVKEIMVPRVDVISVDINSELSDIIQIISDKGHSRLPVFEDNNSDNIVGILHSKDILNYFSKKNNFKLKDIIRDPLFIPESKIINDLLVELREKKIHLAIVVDEYGGMSGIVCLEDIIEKIVGDIQDEFDNEAEDVIQLSETEFLINPRISLEELNETIGTDFIEEEIDTLGGLVFFYFGKIPSKNEKIHHNNYIFTVESISGRQIKNIRLEILKEPES